jgi:surface polysaccharide O-acyltransferase-like enzyme
MLRTRNMTIDTLRLLATLEVIALHVTFNNLPDTLNVLIRLQARWAVPFFFIVSGYFFAQRLSDPKRADVRPALYRLIWLFALWNILYMPLVISEHGVKEVFRRLLFPSFIYIGEYFHLWFPSSLLLGFLVLLFIFHYKLEKWLPLLSLGIMIHILLARSYIDAFDLKFPFDFVIARYWLSVPALALGVWLFRRGPLNRWLALSLTVGGLVLQVIETWFLYTRFGTSMIDHEVLIGTLPFALGIASLGLSGLRFLEHPTLSAWGRDYSLGIYLMHVMVIVSVGKVLKTLIPALDDLAVWDVFYPFLVLATSLGLFIAMKRWWPALFRFLMGDHLSQGN